MPETNKPKWLDRAKESSYVMWKRIIGPDEGKVGFESVDLDVLLPRQGYKESTFLDKNVKGKNSAGAIGIAQVKQRTLKDYPELKGVNLRDPKQGVGAQRVIMDDLLNADFIDKPYQPDSVTAAKALGAYNWGRGNLSAYLNAQKKKGVDIYDTWDWLEGLPKETEDYINKVLRGKDQKFEKNFDRAKKHPYMKFYRKGGGLSREKNYGSAKKPYPSVASGDFAGGGRSYPIPTKADAVDALRLAGLHGRADVKAKVYAKYPELKKVSKAQVGTKLPELPVQEYGNLHINSTFKPNRFNLSKLGVDGKFKAPFKPGFRSFPILDFGGGLIDILREYSEIKNSPNPENKKKELENINEMRRIKMFGEKPGKINFNPGIV